MSLKVLQGVGHAAVPETPDLPANTTAEAEALPGGRPGNSLRWARGGSLVLVGAVAALILMSKQAQWRWGVPLGTALVGLSSLGAMDLLGTFDDADSSVRYRTNVGELGRALGGFVASSFLCCAVLTFAQAGLWLPQLAWGIVVTLAFVLETLTLFRLGGELGVWRVGEQADRAPWKHHGFWLIVMAAVLYFPCMGTYSLWDPWESHYGEVSREILQRDDWISLWWSYEGWFWSKPVLDMWMQAIAMATLGVHYQADKMLIGDGTRPTMHPEWAVRAPIVLLMLVSVYLLYCGAKKAFGARPAFLGCVVLMTMPTWFFIAHQTMADMPFVGAMAACMGLVLSGLHTPEDERVPAREVRIGRTTIRLTSWHLVFGAVLVCALPQILYLLSRNVDFLWQPGGRGFRPHWDEFRSGSGPGNCGLPGSETCAATMPTSVTSSLATAPSSVGAFAWRAIAAFEPALQALLWTVVLGLLLYVNRGERRRRRLYYLGAWFFGAVSTLAKGPAGFGLPALVILAYICASYDQAEVGDRLRGILRDIASFEIGSGLLVILAVAMPWYIASYVRHGSRFTDELIFHDMFNRAFSHVHDTNEGDDTSFGYYVWQLGYGLFPWTGLAPLGLVWWFRTPGKNDRPNAAALLYAWFLFSFALFSFMGTKFHHYILPAVPPLALLIGLALDDMFDEPPRVASASLPIAIGAALTGIALVVFGIGRAAQSSLFDAKAHDPEVDAAILWGMALTLVGLAVLAIGARYARQKAVEEAAPPALDSHATRMLAGAAVSGAFLLVLVTRDLVIKPEHSDQPGAVRLLQLFTYNYRRAWPESLDFSGALIAFGVTAVVASIVLAIRVVRSQVVLLTCALAFVWAGWGLDVYMVQTAPHWGQREVIAAYYADRASPDERLVAYQMNWKGENFYTGNHLPVFVSTGAAFTSWLKGQRDAGARVMYFITEFGRQGGLKGEVGAKSLREITDKTLCNKFVLVRAEL
jgi:4-amino-4-deoxy-L-arabinose transferase-like glycosyltransferase